MLQGLEGTALSVPGACQHRFPRIGLGNDKAFPSNSTNRETTEHFPPPYGSCHGREFISPQYGQSSGRVTNPCRTGLRHT